MTSETGRPSRSAMTVNPAASPSTTKASASSSSTVPSCSSSAAPHPSLNSSPQVDYMQPDELATDPIFDRLDYMRFTFADINGIARTKMISKKGFAHQIKDGIFLFAGSIAASSRSDVTLVDELIELNYGNCVIRAMPATVRELPWATGGKYRVGEVLCETYWISPFRNGAHQDACPRYVARKQLERLKEEGYTLYSTFEPEFMVFKRGTLVPVIDGVDVITSLRQAEVEEYACAVDDNLVRSKVKSSGFLVEHGAGQLEFCLDPSFGVEAADQLFCFKEYVKELTLQPHIRRVSSSPEDGAQQRGDSPAREWQATFMTQPFPDASNNGLHFNHSLWSIDGKQRNLFSDPSDPDGLSAVARHWVAGLVKHCRALTAICCPTVNCYRRLFTPFAPEKNNWGVDDRLASFRVKAYGSKGGHVESRLPSGAGNPYLVLAATVAAGLDGVINRLECPPPRGKDNAGCDLPRSLKESVEALQEDEWMRTALGEEFVRWFVQLKLESDIGLTQDLKDDIRLTGDLKDDDDAARFAFERYLYFDLI